MNPLLIGAAVLVLSGGWGAKVIYDEWSKYDEAFKTYGAKWGVDWKWLKAIALNESDLGRDPRVSSLGDSSDGQSWGLMQITFKTGLSLDPGFTIEKAKQLEPADYSINLAAKLFAQNMQAFNPDEERYLEWVVKSYNQGAGNTKKERAGQIEGYAQEYWERFQRNLERVG